MIPGHVDTPSPAEVQFEGTLSSKTTAGRTPTYNADMLACSNTYCHGNFKNGNTNYTLVWNANSISAAACGTCHGDPSKATNAEKALPKTSANGGTHPNNLACSNCHGNVVNSSGNIISASKHMNGKLNVFGSEREL
jgi:predicted CxxxxCH...CXXCH cytochrome family protein